MRVITLSDLHVRHGATLPETVIALAWVLASIRASATEHQPDVIILGGDLFDTAATAEALLALCGFVQEAANLCEVVILYGNHERARELDVLARLSARFPITVYAKPAIHRIPGLALALIPWIDRVLPIADLAGYTVEQEKIAEEKRLNEILAGLRAELDAVAQPGDARVCAAHLMLDVAIGALKNPGQPDRKGKEFIVSLAQLARLGCQVVALGHVHDGREWEIPGRDPGDAPATIFYNGSTRCWGWGEIKGKRFATIEVTGDAALPARITFTAIPGRAMIQLDDVWTAGPESGAPWGWKLWTGIDGELDDGEAVGAVVRFAYEVPASRAEEARAAAAEVVKALYAAGAHHVQPAPKVQPEQSARRPEMAAAITLEDKLDVYVKGRGIDPSADHVARARRHLSALRLEAGVAGRLAAGGMRLGSIWARGMRAFREPVRLDVEGLPGQIAAMVGPNGAGKSTLLACWPGAEYRSTARTDLRRLALRDGDPVVITTAMVNGEWVAMEHQFARDKSFARKVNAAHDAKPEASGFKGFQAWAEENLLPEDVIRNAIFAGQGSAGLLALGPPERRDPMLKALGLGPLKKLHGLALAKAKEAGRLASTARGARDAARARVEALARPPLPAVVEAEREKIIRLDADVALLDEEERHARAEAGALVVALRAHAAARKSLEDEKARGESALRALEAQLVEHRDLLARADEIRAAVAFVAPLRASIVGGAVNAEQGRRRVVREEAQDLFGCARVALRMIEERARTARQRWASHHEQPEHVARVEVAAELLPGRRAAAASAEAALTLAIATLDAARVEATTKLSGRVDGLLGGHQAVLGIADIEGAHAVSRDAIGADLAAVAAPGALAPLEKAVVDARARLAEARAAVAAVEPDAAKVAEVRRRVNVAAEAALEETHARAEADGARAAVAWLDRQHALAVEACAEFLHWRGLGLTECSRADRVAMFAGALARAEASADTLSGPIAASRAELKEIERRIAELPAPPTASGGNADTLLAAMKIARAGAEAARAFVRAADDAAAVRAEATVSLALAEEALINPAAEEAAWDLLVAFLGPRGLQTIEIDVACPELSAVLRELLGCFGTRWSMTCEASRPTSDGTGEVDAITFPTIDNESDDTEPRDASCFSGGQAVPLAFAIRVALAVLVALRTETTLPTLVFDEPTAALHDIVDFERLMSMIRRAAAMIGAGKVIVVSHSPAFVELADCAIVVGGGKIEVISPARIPDAA